MEYLIVLGIGIFLGAVFFKKDSREKATEAIKHALDKETN